MEDMTTRS